MAFEKKIIQLQVFLFNNTPFAFIKIEDPENKIPLNPCLWEP